MKPKSTSIATVYTYVEIVGLICLIFRSVV